MKYKTIATTTTNEQSFSESIPDYVLDEKTNELIRLEVDKNVQASIQSYVDCALERALERLNAVVDAKNITESDEIIDDYSNKTRDLAVLGEAMELAEQYREDLGLSDTLSVAQIYHQVDLIASDLKKKLADLNSKKEVKADGSVSQEETVPQEEQA